MKIVVVGLGYVGLSNAVLLAQHNKVVGIDLAQQRVDALNNRQSPIVDAELSKYLANKELDISASTNIKLSVSGADYVIVSTPTNYDEKTNFFDTSSVETVISQVITYAPKACIVVKSTVPVGFTDNIKLRLKTDAVIFSPEFLREGTALYDNLHPSRIIVGEKSERAETFAKLLAQGALKPNVELLFTGSREAEAIKLFSNSYLAMRVAYFNELDSYALAGNMDSREIISGVSLDPRIGNHYNNPSFGYGGYCLPKDTKQLLANFQNVPQRILSAIVEANPTRQQFLTDIITKKTPKNVGVYRLAMKSNSDNFRESSVQNIIENLTSQGISVTIYDPDCLDDYFLNCFVETNIEKFKRNSDLIICNRTHSELSDIKYKLFTRDIFNKD